MARKGIDREDYIYEKPDIRDIPQNEQTANNEEKEEKEKENEDEFKELKKQLDEQYILRDRVEDTLEQVKDEVEATGEGIKAAVKGARGFIDVQYKDGKNLTREQEKAEKEIEKIENDALGFPKDKEGITPDSERNILTIVKGLEKKAKDLLNNSRQAREEFVETQIEESKKEAKSQYDQIFNSRKTVNGRIAGEIIFYKIDKEMRAAADPFIRTGEGDKFGIVRMAVRISSFKEGDEGNETEEEYVTGFIINVGGYTKKIGEKYRPNGVPLVLPSDRNVLEDERGNVDRRMV